MPFSTHPLLAHPAFNSFQAVFSGGTVQRVVALTPSAKNSSFSSVVGALLSLLNQILHTKESTGFGRSSATIRSIFLPLPNLKGYTFRVFRIPGNSMSKLLNDLPSSTQDEMTKTTEIAFASSNAAAFSLSIVTNLGLLSFLRVDFPLALFIHKQRNQSLTRRYSGRAGGLQIRCRAVRFRLGSWGI